MNQTILIFLVSAWLFCLQCRPPSREKIFILLEPFHTYQSDLTSKAQLILVEDCLFERLQDRSSTYFLVERGAASGRVDYIIRGEMLSRNRIILVILDAGSNPLVHIQHDMGQDPAAACVHLAASVEEFL